jgi:NAD-dependent SIR2 family protein deacetylase
MLFREKYWFKVLDIMTDLDDRISTLAQWMFDSEYLAVFTGAVISTDSGLRDFRIPDGLCTRRNKGLTTLEQKWIGVETSITEVYGKLRNIPQWFYFFLYLFSDSRRKLVVFRQVD